MKVSDTLREYLKEIRTALLDTESEEERELQISSALEEIEGNEVKVATDVECSRIFETLLEAAPTALLFQLAERITTREALFTIASKCALSLAIAAHFCRPLKLYLIYGACAAVRSARMCWRRYCCSYSSRWAAMIQRKCSG